MHCCPTTHLILLDLIPVVVVVVVVAAAAAAAAAVAAASSSLCSFLQPPDIYSLSGQSTLLSTLFSNILTFHTQNER
jgi:hypothetical protein